MRRSRTGSIDTFGGYQPPSVYVLVASPGGECGGRLGHPYCPGFLGLCSLCLSESASGVSCLVETGKGSTGAPKWNCDSGLDKRIRGHTERKGALFPLKKKKKRLLQPVGIDSCSHFLFLCANSGLGVAGRAMGKGYNPRATALDSLGHGCISRKLRNNFLSLWSSSEMPCVKHLYQCWTFHYWWLSACCMLILRERVGLGMCRCRGMVFQAEGTTVAKVLEQKIQVLGSIDKCFHWSKELIKGSSVG